MGNDSSRAPSNLVLERVPCPLCGGWASRPERIVENYELQRCSACDLVFVNPQPSEQTLTSLYLQKTPESQAEFYRQTVSTAQIAEYDRILADLRSLVPAGGRLLDLGCAAGYFMQRAERAGFEAYGTDLAPWVERVAGERGVRNVRCGHLRAAAFPDSWFDVVHSSQVFEHLPAPGEELREIRRILRPGGVLYINVPNYRCLSIVLGRDDFELNTPPEHVAYYTPGTLAALLSLGGFEVVRTASYGGLKWENLIGRPIRSEIAEAVRAKGTGSRADASVQQTRARPRLLGRLARWLLYRRLQVGMSLEIFGRRAT